MERGGRMLWRPSETEFMHWSGGAMVPTCMKSMVVKKKERRTEFVFEE
jgi:hypothetical protein